MSKETKAEAREMTGNITIVNVTSLDDALNEADASIRKFLGDRTFTMWQAHAEVSISSDKVLTWNVEIDWHVV
jgi:hypothetical protein